MVAVQVLTSAGENGMVAGWLALGGLVASFDSGGMSVVAWVSWKVRGWLLALGPGCWHLMLHGLLGVALGMCALSWGCSWLESWWDIIWGWVTGGMRCIVEEDFETIW
jgi:hypothetical protein